jgi:hypothetical protein
MDEVSEEEEGGEFKKSSLLRPCADSDVRDGEENDDSLKQEDTFRPRSPDLVYENEEVVRVPRVPMIPAGDRGDDTSASDNYTRSTGLRRGPPTVLGTTGAAGGYPPSVITSQCITQAVLEASRQGRIPNENDMFGLVRRGGNMKDGAAGVNIPLRSIVNDLGTTYPDDPLAAESPSVVAPLPVIDVDDTGCTIREAEGYCQSFGILKLRAIAMRGVGHAFTSSFASLFLCFGPPEYSQPLWALIVLLGIHIWFNIRLETWLWLFNHDKANSPMTRLHRELEAMLRRRRRELERQQRRVARAAAVAAAAATAAAATGGENLPPGGRGGHWASRTHPTAPAPIAPPPLENPGESRDCAANVNCPRPTMAASVAPVAFNSDGSSNTSSDLRRHADSLYGFFYLSWKRFWRRISPTDSPADTIQEALRHVKNMSFQRQQRSDADIFS